MATNEKAQICDLLRAFIHQRPGLEFGNYGDVSAYRSESRAITRDLHDAETLLAYVERHDSIGADRLRAAFRDAYSGRLSLVYTRSHECDCGHKWRAMVQMSEHTQNLSGEATQWCPKCGKRPMISNPHTATLDYCTGQYWPTEYRKAACAVLASAVWSWMRDECMPAVSGYRVESWGRYENGKRLVHRHPIGPLPEAESMLRHFGGSDYGHVVALHDGKSAGNYLRAAARREFGAAIARRWFN